MLRYLLIAVISIGGLGLALWVMAEVLGGLATGSSSITTWRQRRAVLANQRKLEDQRQREEAKRRAEEEQISQFRRQHPAQIVGVPDLAALNNAVTVLNEFVAKADAYRRKFGPSFDTKFRAVQFSFPFEFFFPRNCQGSSDGPDPDQWAITLDSLVVPKGRDLRSIYQSVISMEDFPCAPPTAAVFNLGAPPEYPRINLPHWDIKIVTAGGEIDFRVDTLRKAYATEIAQAEKLRQMADDFEEVRRRAEEAKDLMDNQIAKERLAYNSCKQSWEQQYDQQLGPIRSIYKEHKMHTKDGITNHFQFALRTLSYTHSFEFPLEHVLRSK
jgi:hypothetical protein